ncbi:hypothetical protein ACOMHN_015749 [Nucella lapillus]
MTVVMALAKSRSKISLTSSRGHPMRWWCCHRNSNGNKLKVFTSLQSVVRKVSSTGGHRRHRYHLLTAQQRLLVQRTWHKLASEVTMLGQDSMITLWNQCPQVPVIFQLTTKEGRDLQRDPRFRQHACCLIQSISAMVDNIENPDDILADTFIEIGIKHASLPDFPVNSFYALPVAYATVWESHLSGRFRGQTEKSWKKVFEYIASCLTKGFEQTTLMDRLDASFHALKVHVSARSLTARSTKGPDDPEEKEKVATGTVNAELYKVSRLRNPFSKGSDKHSRGRKTTDTQSSKPSTTHDKSPESHFPKPASADKSTHGQRSLPSPGDGMSLESVTTFMDSTLTGSQSAALSESQSELTPPKDIKRLSVKSLKVGASRSSIRSSTYSYDSESEISSSSATSMI